MKSGNAGNPVNTMSKLLKFIGGVFVAFILLGLLVDKLAPKSPAAATPDGRGYPASSMPQSGNGNDPRFNGPDHPMYGKNFYQTSNEVIIELRRSGAPEEQVRLAYMAMEATKCRSCNGYGWRGHDRCEMCRGDGVLEN
jgi:hypothetical protein